MVLFRSRPGPSCLADDLFDAKLTREKLLGRSLKTFLRNSYAAGRVALGVEVDYKNFEAQNTERCSYIYA